MYLAKFVSFSVFGESRRYHILKKGYFVIQNKLILKYHSFSFNKGMARSSEPSNLVKHFRSLSRIMQILKGMENVLKERKPAEIFHSVKIIFYVSLLKLF